MNGTAQKLPYNKTDRDAIFHRVSCEKGEVLSNVIRELGWGNSRKIRESGFQLSECIGQLINHPDYAAIGELKHNNVRDPRYRFEETRTYLANRKRDLMAVVIAF